MKTILPILLNLRKNENEVNKMTKKEHIENLSDIMDSMPDDACGDWRDSIAYAIENLSNDDNELDFAKAYSKISVSLNLIESIKVVEVLEKMKTEMKKWYWDADKQEIAKDPCVVDAMIDLFIRTANKYEKNEVNKTMSIKDRAQSDIKISMSDNDCGDWKDFITHAIEVLKQVSDDYDCCTCTHGTWKRTGWDITMADDACGGCCSWNNKYEPFVNENLNMSDNIDDDIDQMQKDLIKYYLKGYVSVSELSKALKILDKYKKEI